MTTTPTQTPDEPEKAPQDLDPKKVDEVKRSQAEPGDRTFSKRSVTEVKK